MTDSIKIRLKKNDLPIGVVVKHVRTDTGEVCWTFIPYMSNNRIPSRKLHETAFAAVPAWARKIASAASLTEAKEAV